MPRPFRPLPRRQRKKHLPPNIFGLLVGKQDGPLGHTDDNHVFLPLRVSAGPAPGLYRVALTTASTGLLKSAQYFILDQPVPADELPHKGFHPEARLSYPALGVRQADFITADDATLRAAIHATVESAELIAAYGVTFNPFGLHDVHYNNGEPPGSYHRDRPGQDGALTTYLRDPTTGLFTRRWLLIKFQPQTLPPAAPP